MIICTKRLDSGYWRVWGDGPCNWAQPPWWPCDESVFRAHLFAEASDEFVHEAMRVAEQHRGEL